MTTTLSLEIAKLNDKKLKKVAFHDVTCSIRKEEKRRRGREIFFSVRIRLVRYPDRPWERNSANPLNDSLKKVLKYLHIPENTFIMGRRY
jgi:hypothetical protein